MKRRVEEEVHVRLDLPIEKRRALIQAAVDTVQLLKRHEAIHRIRLEKSHEIQELRRLYNSINRMIKDLRLKELPLEAEDLQKVRGVRQVEMEAVEQRMEKVMGAKHGKKEAPRKTPLDIQLDDLQRKLRSL